jgi:glucuronoarabinoxylan endo-1,4-beta-xylanase
MSRRDTSNGKTDTKPDSGVPSDGIAHLVVDVGKQHQTLVGFGAAVAWYANAITGFASDAPINDIAFRDLGLDIIRLRDRYGRQDQNNSSVITDEVTIVERATASLGHPPKILLSSWSPPASLKASGRENCSDSDANNGLNCTLRKGESGFPYDEFAKYFVDSLDYYADAGIVPDYLSIQNEPNFVPNGWEGCYFAGSESALYPGYDKALSAVRNALASVADAPALIGPETISLDNDALDEYVTNDTQSLYAGVAHHLYSGKAWQDPDSQLSLMRSATDTAGNLPLFQTEFDTQNASGSDGGFETAWVMHNSLAVEGLSAFLYWGLVWSGGPTQDPSGGLIWVTRDSTTKEYSYKLRDHYYAMRHFARFTDPGYVRVDASSTLASVRVSGYLAPDSSQLTLVLLNVSSKDAPVKLDTLTGYSGRYTSAYRTLFRPAEPAAAEYWQQQEGFDLTQQFTLPPRAVLTVVLSTAASDAAVANQSP